MAIHEDKNHPKLTPMDAVNQNTAPSLDALSELIYEAVFKAPTTKISLYGLKSPKDVRAFLESPAGESLMTALSIQLSNEEAYHLNQRRAAAEHALLVHRIRAALFFWALKKEALASDRKELTLSMNQEAIERAKPVDSEPKKSADAINLAAALGHYQEALKLNASLLNLAEQEGQKLEELEFELLAQEELIQIKYALLLKEINQFEKTLAEDPAQIETLIEQLKQEMEQSRQEIENLIHVEDISSKMEAHTQIHLKLAAHRDLSAVQKGDYYFADEEGNEVSSEEKAQFILKTNKDHEAYQHHSLELRRSKIIKMDNQYYLLEPGESLDSIKNDPLARAEAQKKYEYSKQNILTLRQVLICNEKAEKEVNQRQIQEVKDKKTLNLEVKSFLIHRKGMLETYLADAQGHLDNPELALRPKPPGATNNPAKNQVSIFNNTKKPEPKPNPELEFRRAVLNYSGPFAERMKLELRLIPLTQPIPPETMKRMLATMEQFGLTATKPGVSAYKNPLELADPTKKLKTNLNTSTLGPKPTKAPEPLKPKTQPVEVVEERPEPKHRAPTPFSIEPDPFDPYKNGG